MDLKDQLKNLFPEHVSSEADKVTEKKPELWLQKEPIICKYEKRKGKPITILEGYSGAEKDFKKLAQDLKKKLSVGGTFKNNSIIIQGGLPRQNNDLASGNGF